MQSDVNTRLVEQRANGLLVLHVSMLNADYCLTPNSTTLSQTHFAIIIIIITK